MRDHSVAERASTPLELFFDLCFVVAVAFLAAELHHGITAGHAADALVRYALLFVPIWWAWMSYTWFATAFSHDDAITRILTFAQMAGVLGVAAAVPAAFTGSLVPFAVASTVMRIPLILQWVRAAVDDPPHRSFAMTYAIGSACAQVLWLVGAVLAGGPGLAVFAVALAVELGTPVLAVRRSPDRVFHPGHIAERYGLFTIIVLGESVLAVSVGLRETVPTLFADGRILAFVTLGLVVAFTLWWVYFGALSADALVRNRRAAFVWGYGHYLLFAAVAAVGAGLQAQVQVLAADGRAGGAAGAAVVAGAFAVCLLTMAWLRRAADPAATVAGYLVAASAGAGLAVWAAVGGPAVGVAVGTALLGCVLAARGWRANAADR